MPADIVQALLHHAIEMHARTCFDGKRRAGFFIVNGKSRLPLHCWNVPVQRRLKPGFFQKHGMQRLREPAHFVQRGLRDFLNLFQIFAQRRITRHLFACARKQ